MVSNDTFNAPGVLEIARGAGAPTDFGETWHSDNSYMAEPSLGSILHSIEVPPVGNDTLFSCSYNAYETLSPTLRAILDDLNSIHTAGEAFSPSSVSGGSFDNPEATMKYERAKELLREAAGAEAAGERTERQARHARPALRHRRRWWRQLR